MTNVEAANSALRVWYGASALEFKGISYAQAANFLANGAGLHMESFGAECRMLGNYKTEDAMFSLGELNQGKIPYPVDFIRMLRDRVDPAKITNYINLHEVYSFG